jgi:hypothetical protein
MVVDPRLGVMLRRIGSGDDMFSHYFASDDTATRIGYFIGDVVAAFVAVFVIGVLLVQFVRF